MFPYWVAQSTIDTALQGAAASFASPDPDPTATVDQVLSPYIYVFYASFIVAYFFTPMMRQVAVYYHVIDRPDANRKMHKEPVAYLGGVAVFLGWMAGLAMSQFVQAHRVDVSLPHLHWPLAIVIGATMVVALGLWDDIHKIKPWMKIVVQVIAALALLHGGIGTHCIDPLMAPLVNRWAISHQLNLQLIQYSEWVLSGLLTVVLVVGSCNAANLMDGLDGLCGGVSGIIAIGFVFLAVHMATIGHIGSTNTDGMRIVLGLALLGAVLGFVPFNFNPASIFLGDTGSMFIGYAFAVMMAMMAEERSKWFLAGLVMYALPILDTALAFVRRWVNKRPLFSADRHHIHHQLLTRGFTIRQTVIISYGLTICFVMMGAAIVFLRTRYVVAAYMVIFGSIIVAAFKGGLVHEKQSVSGPRTLSDPQSLSSDAPNELNSELVLEVRTSSQKIQ
jgi:UDP-GlcNAc:undecaprenyl-phosphate/decaprenyl-phosphate GlcNAc-1-phosphate transferase